MAQPPATVSIREYLLPSGSRPHQIAIDSMNRVYYTDMGRNTVGRLESGVNVLTEFPVPTPNANPYYIAIDRDDNVWITESRASKIARINFRTGFWNEWQLPEGTACGIAIDPGNNVWFTWIRYPSQDAIGLLYPRSNSDNLVRYLGSNANTRLRDITVDSRTYVFATAQPQNHLVWYRPGDNAFSWCGFVTGPYGITVDDSNVIWLTEYDGNKISKAVCTPDFCEDVRQDAWTVIPAVTAITENRITISIQSITVTGATTSVTPVTASRFVTAWPIPTPSCGPYEVAWEPSGQGTVWFTEQSTDKVGALHPSSNTMTEYQLSSGSYPLGIAASHRGDVWFAETMRNRVGEIAQVPPCDFSLSAIPAALVMPADLGQSETSRVTVSPVTGSCTVSLSHSWSGLAPTGVSVTFNPNLVAVPPSGSSTLSVRIVGPSLPTLGTYVLKVTGTCGNVVHSIGINLTFVPPFDFYIRIAPSLQTVPQVGSTTFTVFVTRTSGPTPQLVGLACSGPFSNTNLLLMPPFGMTDFTSTLSVSTLNERPGTYTISVTGTGGGKTHTATATLVVTPLPNFVVSVSPGARTVDVGGRTTYNVGVTSVGGFSGIVGLFLSGPPSDAQYSFAPSNGTASFNSTLTIQAGRTTGSFQLTIFGVSGQKVSYCQATLSIVEPPDFSLQLSAYSLLIPRGSSADCMVDVVPSGGFANDVRLSADGLPPGIVASFDPEKVTPRGTSTLKVNATTCRPGVYSINVKGSGGGKTHLVSLTLLIYEPPDFVVQVIPSTQTVRQGESTTYAVRVIPTGGFSSPVTLSLSGFPADANRSFVPSVLTSGDATLVITAGATTGTFDLVVTGAGGGLDRSAGCTLHIVSNPAADEANTTMRTARDEIDKAKREWRTDGLDEAEKKLQDAKDAYAKHKYDLALRLAKEALALALASRVPLAVQALVVLAVLMPVMLMVAFLWIRRRKKEALPPPPAGPP